jgi:hypothetical protein
MAANTTKTPGMTFTLSGTTADTVVMESNPAWVLLVNHDPTYPAYWRQDGTTAVGEQAGTRIVPPGFGTALVPYTSATAISVVGNGNKITAQVDPGPR